MLYTTDTVSVHAHTYTDNTNMRNCRNHQEIWNLIQEGFDDYKQKHPDVNNDRGFLELISLVGNVFDHNFKRNVLLEFDSTNMLKEHKGRAIIEHIDTYGGFSPYSVNYEPALIIQDLENNEEILINLAELIANTINKNLPEKSDTKE